MVVTSVLSWTMEGIRGVMEWPSFWSSLYPLSVPPSCGAASPPAAKTTALAKKDFSPDQRVKFCFMGWISSISQLQRVRMPSRSASIRSTSKTADACKGRGYSFPSSSSVSMSPMPSKNFSVLCRSNFSMAGRINLVFSP